MEIQCKAGVKCNKARVQRYRVTIVDLLRYVTQDGTLSTGHNQEMDGEDVVSLKGAIYLCESGSPEVIVVSISELGV